jgi:hypothetical protein
MLGERGETMRHTLLSLLLAAGLAAGPAAATVIEGRPAQALRCAAYIGMAGQYGFADGRLNADDRAFMAGWSVAVLAAWLPFEPAGRMSAYVVALGELGSRREAHALIERHAEWCLRAFTPGLL